MTGLSRETGRSCCRNRRGRRSPWLLARREPPAPRRRGPCRALRRGARPRRARPSRPGRAGSVGASKPRVPLSICCLKAPRRARRSGPGQPVVVVGLPALPAVQALHEHAGVLWVAVLVEHYLSNTASFVLRVFRHVKDHHTLLHYLPNLKKPCVRQVVLDKWLPSSPAGRCASPSAPPCRGSGSPGTSGTCTPR